jgi:hypothetical protein
MAAERRCEISQGFVLRHEYGAAFRQLKMPGSRVTPRLFFGSLGPCVRSRLPHPSFQLARLLQLSDLVADLSPGARQRKPAISWMGSPRLTLLARPNRSNSDHGLPLFRSGLSSITGWLIPSEHTDGAGRPSASDRAGSAPYLCGHQLGSGLRRIDVADGSSFASSRRSLLMRGPMQ